jgi:hypothetical protein
MVKLNHLFRDLIPELIPELVRLRSLVDSGPDLANGIRFGC